MNFNSSSHLLPEGWVKSTPAALSTVQHQLFPASSQSSPERERSLNSFYKDWRFEPNPAISLFKTTSPPAIIPLSTGGDEPEPGYYTMDSCNSNCPMTQPDLACSFVNYGVSPPPPPPPLSPSPEKKFVSELHINIKDPAAGDKPRQTNDLTLRKVENSNPEPAARSSVLHYSSFETFIVGGGGSGGGSNTTTRTNNPDPHINQFDKCASSASSDDLMPRREFHSEKFIYLGGDKPNEFRNIPVFQEQQPIEHNTKGVLVKSANVTPASVESGQLPSSLGSGRSGLQVRSRVRSPHHRGRPQLQSNALQNQQQQQQQQHISLKSTADESSTPATHSSSATQSHSAASSASRSQSPYSRYFSTKSVQTSKKIDCIFKTLCDRSVETDALLFNGDTNHKVQPQHQQQQRQQPHTSEKVKVRITKPSVMTMSHNGDCSSTTASEHNSFSINDHLSPPVVPATPGVAAADDRKSARGVKAGGTKPSGWSMTRQRARRRPTASSHCPSTTRPLAPSHSGCEDIANQDTYIGGSYSDQEDYEPGIDDSVSQELPAALTQVASHTSRKLRHAAISAAKSNTGIGPTSSKMKDSITSMKTSKSNIESKLMRQQRQAMRSGSNKPDEEQDRNSYEIQFLLDNLNSHLQNTVKSHNSKPQFTTVGAASASSTGANMPRSIKSSGTHNASSNSHYSSAAASFWDNPLSSCDAINTRNGGLFFPRAGNNKFGNGVTERQKSVNPEIQAIFDNLEKNHLLPSNGGGETRGSMDTGHGLKPKYIMSCAQKTTSDFQSRNLQKQLMSGDGHSMKVNGVGGTVGNGGGSNGPGSGSLCGNGSIMDNPYGSHDNIQLDPRFPSNLRYQRCFDLSPYDELVKSHLNSSDRRIKSVAAKNGCRIAIDGPISLVDPSSTCQAIRNKIAYRCVVAGQSKERLDKCLNYLKETFPNTCLRLHTRTSLTPK